MTTLAEGSGREGTPDSVDHANVSGRPLRNGFPKSMLFPTASSGGLMKLLRAHGLTTAAIKEALGTQWARKAIGKVTGHRDDALVNLLGQPRRRANFFVWTVGNRKRIAPYYYLLSPEKVILAAFAPDWQANRLDTEVLEAECSQWKDIFQGLAKGPVKGADVALANVFMVWPRIRSALESRDGLNEQDRELAAYSAFALSTLAGDDWFVRRAIELAPSLGSDMAHLLRDSRPENGGEAPGEEPTEEQEEEQPPESRPNAVEAVSLTWSDMREKLASLSEKWSDKPSRQLASELVELSARAAEFMFSLPDDSKTPGEVLDDAIDILVRRLHEQGGTPSTSWLGGDATVQICARWRIASGLALSSEETLRLATDSGQAHTRIDLALEEMRLVDGEVLRARLAAEELERQLGELPSAMRRIELARRCLQAKEESVAAERRWSDAMLKVLSAASPFGTAFDPQIDYAGEAPNPDQSSARGHEDSGGALSSDAPSVPKFVEAEATLPQERANQDFHDSALEGRNELESLGQASNESTPLSDINLPIERLSSFIDDTEPQPDANRESAIDLEPVTESRPDVAVIDEFSDAAGRRCRPIWTLLRHGRPGLAFQYAAALHDALPEMRVPPPALLKCAALAPGLRSGDGPLAMALGESFADIEAAWFEPGDTPSNWHTALNLLLIAATLRPMMQAPSTGAAVVASYRHLDGRHESILQLTRKIEGVSELLTGFSIDATALQSAADDSTLRAQLDELSRDASDWLQIRAPSKKNRYAPASQVWLHWLKPGELIHSLVSPVANGETMQRMAVRLAVEKLSDYNIFLERLEETDRRHLKRRGQNIEGGALENLWTSTCEAVAIAKGWLSSIGMLSESGGRLRELVSQLQAAFEDHAKEARIELARPWLDDEWGQVSAASEVLLHELDAITNMLKGRDAVHLLEPQSKELLTRELLLVPAISLGEGWNVRTGGDELLDALERWTRVPIDVIGAFNGHIERGNIRAAELLLPLIDGELPDGSRLQVVERAKDQWIRDIQRCIQQARRSSEVGLAFGYLSDSERSAFESELSALEAGSRDSGRFDDAMSKVVSISSRIEGHKAVRLESARAELERERPRLTDEVAAQVEAPLERSDIHTFNELMQRVRQGSDPWPELERRRDAFREFFPTLHAALNDSLISLDPLEIDKRIGSGGAIGPLSFDLEGDVSARAEAEQIYRIWATAVSRHLITRDSVRKILETFGFSVRGLEQDKGSVRGLSTWSLVAGTVDDREICPVPHFGSRAQGRYRVVCITDRLTPEDLLQRLGGETQQVATIVLTFARSPQRFWPDLARASKERQRSFLLLDEAMLLYLLAQSGSRLATWFNVALPFTYSDPYDASAGFVPPEMFYGRASELESVKMQGGCYFIYGGRQLGKTALLRRAEKTFHDPASDRYAVWLDLLAQGIGERRPASDVWLSIFDKLRDLKIAGLEVPAVNPGKPSSIDAGLSAIKEFLLAKPGRRVLLLLDEADRFFEQDGRQGSGYAETRRLKQLMDETERRFKVVFAGLHNVLRTVTTSNQPLGHLNEAVRIGPLLEEREIRAAEDLITRPIQAAGFDFDDRSLVMRVLAQTNYYPSLIQLYCTQLLRHLRETKMQRRGVVGPRFKIEEFDIESVFSGRPLRDAIRAKFRLTLQLDDRYEVIANAIGLEALTPGFEHSEGIEWRKIWHDCRTIWWAEGFVNTTERDFMALLEEMVQLGVLSQSQAPDHFSLRNPNVLLLLGSKQEIENTLQAEREPRIEFESTIFRPALGGRVDEPARNPLTYRQLDEVMQFRNSVLLVAASEAAGASNLLPGLRDQPGMTGSRLFVMLDAGLTDKKAFRQQLDKEAQRRVPDGITVMMVPAHVPWDSEWVAVAQAKLKALTSRTSFISVVFLADPDRLWMLAGACSQKVAWIEPWLSVLPWSRGFVRKWLEELQLATDAVDRLKELTGYWGGLLEAAGRGHRGALDFANALERMAESAQDPDWLASNRRLLTGGIEEAERVLVAMSSLGDGVTENDLVEFAEIPRDLVQRTLRWAEPLGLITQEPGAFWTLDSFAKRMLSGDA